jgi:hypothetical protein
MALTDKELGEAIKLRARATEQAALTAAVDAYRAETDPLGYPAPSADGMTAGIAAALLAVAESFRVESDWWENSHKRGGITTAKEYKTAAARLAGVGAGMQAFRPSTQLTPAPPSPVVELDDPALYPSNFTPMFDACPILPAGPVPINGCMLGLGHGGTIHTNVDGESWPDPTPVSSIAAYLADPDPAAVMPDPTSTVEVRKVQIGDQADIETVEEYAHSYVDPFTDPAPMPAPTNYGEVMSWDQLLGGPVGPRPDHWSWSQLEAQEDCGTKHALSRLFGVARRPAWSLVGGNAFHAWAEALERALGDPSTAWPGAARLTAIEYERQGITKSWMTCLSAEIAKTAVASGRPPADWYAAKNGAEAYDWWRVSGEEMCVRYLDWRSEVDFPNALRVPLNATAGYPAGSIPPPGVELAIELPFRINLADVGQLPLWYEGVIDAAWLETDSRAPAHQRRIAIVDLKTGSHAPTDPLQLASARIALELQYGVRADVWTGRYWMARTGKLSEPAFDLTDMGRWLPQLRARVSLANAAVSANLFAPRLSSFCKSCDVRRACPAVNP